jgi:hypothetical protein
MQIPVIDTTAHWGAVLPEACRRWNAALASRGITLVYQDVGALPCGAAPLGAIAVCDSDPRPADQRLGQGQHAMGANGWSWGRVWFYIVPGRRRLVATAVALHELGHAMGLAHQPGDSTSVMNPRVRNQHPTAQDAANALTETNLPSKATRRKRRRRE